MKDVYVVYGCGDKFDKSKFKPIENPSIDNLRVVNKPLGGLWSSPEDSELSWKLWCEKNSFNLSSGFSSCFKFTLKQGASVYEINKVEDLQVLPMITCSTSIGCDIVFTDFETISKSYGAIHFTKKGVESIENNSQGFDLETDTDPKRIYNVNLVGWDCETMLILNSSVIDVIEENFDELELDIIWKALLDINYEDAVKMDEAGLSWKDLPSKVRKDIVSKFDYITDSCGLLDKDKYKKLIIDYWNS